MSENTPNIKLRTKESERPVVKIKNLPIDKRTENFAIKDDNSSVSDSSVISYKKMKPKKEKEIKRSRCFYEKEKIWKCIN